MQNKSPDILKNTGSLIVKYPEAVEFTNQQLKIFWLPDEIHVDKDVQDILVNMTDAEKHGVITTLKLFTMYELKAGAEFWSGKFKRMFKRSEFQRLGATFSMFELAVHQPFYQKINELLHIHTDEFYNSYADDPTLKSRMEFIDNIVGSKNDLLALAGFSMVEGAILYSSFAFLKHFQSQGKNKLLNVVRGINFSVRDENLHSEAGAWAFRTLKQQYGLDEQEEAELKTSILEMAKNLYEHECRIVEMVFEKGSIPGITAKQMQHFVESRINVCLVNLGYEKMFDVSYNPIGEWFYKGINNFQFNDFFSGQGREYTRDWDEAGFVWSSVSE